MPGHSRSKNGVASLAYVPGIHVLICRRDQRRGDGRDKLGRTPCSLRHASLVRRLEIMLICALNRPEGDMTIAELIFEQVKKLPDQAAREVLDFVGYIRERGEWRDLMQAQSASLAPVWDNSEDKVWDNA
jgi:hypothetical protein